MNKIRALVIAVMLLAVAPLFAQWVYDKDVDPITDEVTSFIMLPSEDERRILVIRKSGDDVEIYVVWAEYMIVEDEHYVTVRLDSDPALTVRAGKSTDNRASFLLSENVVDLMLNKNTKRLVVRIMETSGSQTTAVFSLGDFKEACEKGLGLKVNTGV